MEAIEIKVISVGENGFKDNENKEKRYLSYLYCIYEYLSR
jgi:hypothetical protein